MKAMIFAAGIGSRLQPLTNEIPKALVEVEGKTMLERTILHLRQYGFDDLIINLHHFPEMIKSYVLKHEQFGANISFSEERSQLLDTGGGLKKASWFFRDDQSFLIHNVDIISNLDLARLYAFHKKNKALATLVVRERESSRYLLFNRRNELCGWENEDTGEKKVVANADSYHRLAFSGIHIAETSIFGHMPDKNIFSIMEAYIEAARQKKIIAYIDGESHWFDIGNLENLEKAREFISQREPNDQ